MATAVDIRLMPPSEAVEVIRQGRADLEAYRRNLIAGRVERDDDWQATLEERVAAAEYALGLTAAEAPEMAFPEAEPEAELLTLF
jgi:hypothetical protein